MTDEQLLKRLGAFYPKAFVATVTKELAEARRVLAYGMATDGEAMGVTGKSGAKAKAGLVRAMISGAHPIGIADRSVHAPCWISCFPVRHFPRFTRSIAVELAAEFRGGGFHCGIVASAKGGWDR